MYNIEASYEKKITPPMYLAGPVIPIREHSDELAYTCDHVQMFKAFKNHGLATNLAFSNTKDKTLSNRFILVLFPMLIKRLIYTNNSV